MQKIDYGDINKFLVSIGLVLITLSFVVPYLYLKEDFGLMINLEEYSTLTNQMKEIFNNKQLLIHNYQKYLPCISGALLLIGLSALGAGLFRWFRRQAIVDKKLTLDNDKLELEIKTLTAQEKYDNAKQEIQDTELLKEIESLTETIDNSTKLLTEPKAEPVLEYLNVESRTVDTFIAYRSPNFEVLASQLIGNKYAVDLLMRSENNKKYSDRIIEIKYFSNTAALKSLTNSVTKLSQVTRFYANSYSRNVVPVLIVVYSSKYISTQQADDYKKILHDGNKLRSHMKRLKIEFIEENHISDFDVRKVLKR